MQDETSLTPAQRELERALRSATPTAARLDPVASAFAAGRKSGQRQVAVWRAAAGLALVIGVVPHMLPTGRAPSKTGHEPAMVAVETSPAMRETPAGDESLLVLQESVSRRGLDGLPARPLPAARPIRADEKI